MPQVEANGQALGDRLEGAPESMLRYLVGRRSSSDMPAEEAEKYLAMAEAFEAAELPVGPHKTE